MHRARMTGQRSPKVTPQKGTPVAHTPTIRRRSRDRLPDPARKEPGDDYLTELMREVDGGDPAPGAIPRNLGERLRYFRDRARANGGRMSPEVLPWLYETMIRLRLSVLVDMVKLL